MRVSWQQQASIGQLSPARCVYVSLPSPLWTPEMLCWSELHGGVGRGSGSGSAMGHPGFSLVPSFCFEPAE